MKHPSTAELALAAGGDLPFARALLVRFHLSGCSRCRQQHHAFVQLREDSAAALGALPPGLDWAHLEAEMRANIRLGLTAGAIAGHALEPGQDEPAPPAAAPLNWSLASAWLPGAAVVASLALVVALVWVLSHPPSTLAPDRMNGAAPMLTAVDSGIEVRLHGAALTLLAPPAGHASLAVNLGAGARAEYVDAETGQMTIHQVYYGSEE
jgi:hypothetical protein